MEWNISAYGTSFSVRYPVRVYIIIVSSRVCASPTLGAPAAGMMPPFGMPGVPMMMPTPMMPAGEGVPPTPNSGQGQTPAATPPQP